MSPSFNNKQFVWGEVELCSPCMMCHETDKSGSWVDSKGWGRGIRFLLPSFIECVRPAAPTSSSHFCRQHNRSLPDGNIWGRRSIFPLCLSYPEKQQTPANTHRERRWESIKEAQEKCLGTVNGVKRAELWDLFILTHKPLGLVIKWCVVEAKMHLMGILRRCKTLGSRYCRKPKVCHGLPS